MIDRKSRDDLGMDKDAISKVNERLKNAAIPVRIRPNGGRLVLRVTLPKKPGEGLGTKQYDLSPGIPASKDGLRRAELEAQKLGGLLAMGKFEWSLYLKPKDQPLKALEKPIAQLVEEFKAQYMRSNRLQEATWKETWQRTFDRLPQNEPLSEANLLAVVLTTANHSRIRQQTCQRLQRLADFAKLEIDLKSYQGEYGDRSTEARDIPADALILEWREKIPNPAWQWVYGMLAAFGLRPHEAFFCEFLDAHTVKVPDGTKTGHHIVRVIPPEWVERWELTKINRPKVSGKTNRAYGQRVSHQFNRYSVPFVPYDLRHAYAIRGSIVVGLPISTMASMMGHSVAVHTKVYHRWLTDATNEAVYVGNVILPGWTIALADVANLTLSLVECSIQTQSLEMLTVLHSLVSECCRC